MAEQLAVVVHRHQRAWLFPLCVHQAVVRCIVLEVRSNVEATILALEGQRRAVRRIFLNTVLLRKLVLCRTDVYAALYWRRHCQARGSLVRDPRAQFIWRFVPALYEVVEVVGLIRRSVVLIRGAAIEAPVLRFCLGLRDTQSILIEAGH